jgi:hypothetical protein
MIRQAAPQTIDVCHIVGPHDSHRLDLQRLVRLALCTVRHRQRYMMGADFSIQHNM